VNTNRLSSAEPEMSKRLDGLRPPVLPHARSTFRVRTLSRSMVAAMLFLGCSAALQAQTDDERREFFRPTSRWWSIDLDVSSMFDDNIDRDDTAKRRDLSVVPRVVTRLADRNGANRFSLTYGAGARTYSASDQPRGAVSDLEATFERHFGSKKSRVVVGATGEHSIRVSSDDNELVNQFTASPFVEKRWRAMKFAGYGGYRFKRVAQVVGDDTTRLVGTDFARELGDRHVLGLGYRYESTASIVPNRRYARSTYAVDYGARLGTRNRLQVELELRQQRYLARLVRVNGTRVPRADFRWTPAAIWVHDFPQGHQLRVGYQLERRTSNDPDKYYTAHRAEFGIRFALSGRGFREDPRSLLKRDGSRIGFGRSPARSTSIVLDQVRLLAANKAYDRKEGQSFSQGSSWKDVLQAQGVPSSISERSAFFEELWFYKSSWVVLNDGRVTSWHDTGNLRLAPEQLERPPSAAGTESPRVIQQPGTQMPTLGEIAAKQKTAAAPRALGSGEPNVPIRASASGSAEATTGGALSPTRRGWGPDAVEDESRSAAVGRFARSEVVLKDGTRIEGLLQKYEKGLAYIILISGPQGKSTLTTVPEDLIDKEATAKGALEKEPSAQRVGGGAPTQEKKSRGNRR